MKLLAKFLISITNDFLSMDNAHPLKIEFETALRQYVLKRWGLPLMTEMPELPGNPDEPTIAELRHQAETLVLESHRLESLGTGKRVYTLRKPGAKQFIFADSEEKEVRYFALQNPNDEHRMYEEYWVKDTDNGDKLRVVSRMPMDIPTITARTQGAS